MKKQVMRKEI